MEAITERITKIETRLNKIPCLNGDKCGLHKEIMETLEVIMAIVKSNQIEFADHRKALVILIEEQGIPCDDIIGWDLNNYREKNKEKKNVRGSRIQGSRNENPNVIDEKGSFSEREKRARAERKRFLRKRKREEKNKRKRGKKNV